MRKWSTNVDGFFKKSGSEGKERKNRALFQGKSELLKDIVFVMKGSMFVSQWEGSC